MVILKKAFLFLVLWPALWASSGYGQNATCDIRQFSSVPEDFSDLRVYDLQDRAPTASDWSGNDLIEIGDLDVTGTAWITTSWCIPGMDDNAPGCGGQNLYIASPVDMNIVPVEPVTRIGFDYGSQGPEFNFEVTLSDGQVISLAHPWNGDWNNASPAVGFFGYCTGNPNLTIASIHLTAFDGGIDNLRYGLAGGGCDLANIGQAIVDLSLPQGLERSLLAQVNSATSAVERGNDRAARGILEAMINYLEAQSGKKMGEEAASQLIGCLGTILSELPAP